MSQLNSEKETSEASSVSSEQVEEVSLLPLQIAIQHLYSIGSFVAEEMHAFFSMVSKNNAIVFSVSGVTERELLALRKSFQSILTELNQPITITLSYEELYTLRFFKYLAYHHKDVKDETIEVVLNFEKLLGDSELVLEVIDSGNKISLNEKDDYIEVSNFVRKKVDELLHACERFTLECRVSILYLLLMALLLFQIQLFF